MSAVSGNMDPVAGPTQAPGRPSPQRTVRRLEPAALVAVMSRDVVIFGRYWALDPGRHIAAFLVVAQTSIDHDPAARRRLDHQRMDRHFEAAFLGGEMRNQPG